MKELLVSWRNAISGALYRRVLKPFYFRRDPEDVHDMMTKAGAFLGRHAVTRALTYAAFGYSNPHLASTVDGISYRNPIGLAAGFDKDALLTDILPSVGFGFTEAGSVTGEPCAGNPRPRLWRLPESQSLVVWYGLKNRGCEEIAGRMKEKKFKFPVGFSAAKTNCAETVDAERGIADYAKAFAALAPLGSYMTVNISCPNAFGGQPFTDVGLLERLLTRLDGIPCDRPIYLKLSPDVTDQELAEIVATARRHRVHGFICSNLTKKRDNPNIKAGDTVPDRGGMSGKVSEPLADAQLRRVRELTGGKMTVIGCGGVFTAEDAYRKIRAGASLIQLITGMIFRGPQAVSEINQGLARLLKRDGFKSVSEAVGVDSAELG